jgi:hypothetical protein
LIQPKKPPLASTGAAAAGAATGAALATGATGVGGGISGNTPLMTGSCLFLILSASLRRVMPTSSCASSIIV